MVVSNDPQEKTGFERADGIGDLLTLNHIAETLYSTPDVYQGLDRALVELLSLMGLETGWIFLRHDVADGDNEGSSQVTVDRSGYALATYHNLPPAMSVDHPKTWEQAWSPGCDCQRLCDAGLLQEPYNEVQCSRLAEARGDRGGLRVHASAPLRAGDRTLGILNVACSDWQDFSPRSLAMLANVGIQMGITLERARLSDLLQERRVEEQAILLDISNQLLTRLHLDDLMQYLVTEVRQLLAVDAVALLLLDEEAPDQLVYRAALGYQADPASIGRRVPADARSGSGRVLQSRDPLLINVADAPVDLPDITVNWLKSEGFQAAAIVPMIAKERPIGTLIVDTRHARHFNNSEVRLLKLMANQAAIAIEQVRLSQEEVLRHRLEEELDVGRRIQLSLLPKSRPDVAGWDFHAIYQAALQVGGDFYDYFPLPGQPERLGLVIADVTDKGVPAAIYMAVSRTVIRSAALDGQAEARAPADTLKQANRLLLAESQTDFFLSAFYGLLDTTNSRLTYARAGHNPPLLFRSNDGQILELAADGIVLGVLPEIDLAEEEVSIAPGDVLVFFTDGVTEALNGEAEEFGLARLREVVAQQASGNAEHILWAVVNAVNAFANGVDQSDDFTLLIVKKE